MSTFAFVYHAKPKSPGNKPKKIDILCDACYPSQAVVQGRGSIVRHITNWCYPAENPQERGRGEKKKTWL